jgi:hypothetical protein
MERASSARASQLPLNRLRQDQAVSSADFVRFLLAWQKLAPDHRGGPEVYVNHRATGRL